MSNPADNEKEMKQAALDYHSIGQKGKIEVVPTKPCLTQWDLSLAYSPGVAAPCLKYMRTLTRYMNTQIRGTLLELYQMVRRY